MTLVEHTIDPKELEHYESVASLWWDLKTVAGWLHKYNLVRVPYISREVCKSFGRDANAPECLRGLRILDIGCGGGVLCEPLARLGAKVTGIDPARTAIGVAKRHAIESGLTVDYRCDTLEEVARTGEKFDVVVAMEVVEHVAHIDSFLDKCIEVLPPGGVLILSTINRTWKSYAFAIVMGEYILRLLPRGAHQWRKFVRPEEIGVSLERNKVRVNDVSGVDMNLRSRRLQLSSDLSVNYIMAAQTENVASAPHASTFEKIEAV